MRLLFFRHGDPDYEIDGLTDKGKREAELLAKRICAMNIDDIYVSPLGRAKATSEYSIKELQKEAVTCDWLREFPALFDANEADDETRRAFPNELRIDSETGKYHKRIVWDVMPSYYGRHPELFDVNAWRDSEFVKHTDMIEAHDHVVSEFDKLLSKYGYERSGSIYKVRENNEKVLAFFYHFGITSVLLSHLWGVSPLVTMQFLAMAPHLLQRLLLRNVRKESLFSGHSR
ncbi:histidine phosphatase family protein [Butyrivibrio sp. MB2005]|uniref:histidine phosphatase family protein n=1 Tax=Butyrivibrio sp. MB2005 TaxID=1280678 RepID=UPI00040C907F|nr:histidine phosphatase family protein [Butyrivibrio sp. MB2005]